MTVAAKNHKHVLATQGILDADTVMHQLSTVAALNIEPQCNI
jgi:hypothetical protein